MTPTFRRATFPPNSWRGITINRNKIEPLCLILDQDLLRTTPAQAMTAALEAGVRFFQYRNKNSPRKHIYETCLELAALARTAASVFIVNDHADIALAVNAHGVHLGQDDLPLADARKIVGRDMIIGISTHSPEQAVAAEEGGADYIGFGPIFETSTKDAGRAHGADGITRIKQAVSLPVVVIGGINLTNVSSVIHTKADGVAVISAICSAPDFKSAAAEMVKLISRNKEEYQGGI